MNLNNNTFILRPQACWQDQLKRSNSDIENSLSLTYKNNEGEINQLKIRKTDNIWYTIYENDEGEPIDISHKYVENIIQKIMLDNNYIGV